jgi:hypothetical protein
MNAMFKTQVPKVFNLNGWRVKLWRKYAKGISSDNDVGDLARELSCQGPSEKIGISLICLLARAAVNLKYMEKVETEAKNCDRFLIISTGAREHREMTIRNAKWRPVRAVIKGQSFARSKLR